MAHTLPDLPYAYDALAPYLDEMTLQFHHDKHHASYVEKLNAAEAQIADARKSGDFSAIRAVCDALAFNYSGHLFHSIYWTCMSPDGGGEPQGALSEQIAKDFGNLDTFKSEFTAAADAVQGSGWAVLVWQPMSAQLQVLQSEKHQDLSQWGATPIMVLDVWEHAYYLQYQNRKPEFTQGFFDVVNWSEVDRRLREAT